jgi:uncharacterized membrane protein YphA (DoxX/SURF4 family)
VFIATCVVVGLFAAVLLLSAYGKLTRDDKQIDTILKVGFPERYLWALAVCESAGAVGIVAGLFWRPIGIAAAIGVVLYFALAVVSHLRIKHYDLRASGGMLVVAIAVLVLLAMTA